MLVPMILATAALLGAFEPEMVVRHAAEAEAALSVCPRDEVLRAVDLPRRNLKSTAMSQGASIRG